MAAPDLTAQIAETIEGALVNEGILSPSDLRAIDPAEMFAVAVAVAQVVEQASSEA
jgi:hypothetical protein